MLDVEDRNNNLSLAGRRVSFKLFGRPLSSTAFQFLRTLFYPLPSLIMSVNFGIIQLAFSPTNHGNCEMGKGRELFVSHFNGAETCCC